MFTVDAFVHQKAGIEFSQDLKKHIAAITFTVFRKSDFLAITIHLIYTKRKNDQYNSFHTGAIYIKNTIKNPTMFPK
jgi:hypothetical protein